MKPFTFTLMSSSAGEHVNTGNVASSNYSTSIKEKQNWVYEGWAVSREYSMSDSNAAALGLVADGCIYIFLVCGDTNTRLGKGVLPSQNMPVILNKITPSLTK